MTWGAAPLTEDQRDIVGLVLPWCESLEPIESDDSHGPIDSTMAGLLELGIWSIGMPEPFGGGAPLDLRLLAIALLSRHSAALAWACAQAHSAVEALTDAGATVAADIAEGQLGVAIVDLASPHAHLTVDGGTVVGTIDRIDPARDSLALVLLGEGKVWLTPPTAIELGPVLRRTGLAGAHTARATVLGPAMRIEGADVDGIRARLRLSAAAISMGIAERAVGLAHDYADQRTQFGGPLAALPAVQHSLERQSRRVNEARAAVLTDGGTSATRAAGVLADATSHAIDACSAALQVHGGYGYIEEYTVARLLRDAVSIRAASACRP